MIFDLLWLDGPLADGADLRGAARAAGSSSGSPARRGRRRRTTSATARRLLEASRAQGLEGIIAKRLDCPYTPGRRSSGWVKVKNVRRADAVIGGWLPGEEGRSGRLGALVVGFYEDGELRYAGRVGSGLQRGGARAARHAPRRPRARGQPVHGPPAAEGDALRRAAARLRGRLLRGHQREDAAPALVQGPARRHRAGGRRAARRGLVRVAAGVLGERRARVVGRSGLAASPRSSRPAA